MFAAAVEDFAVQMKVVECVVEASAARMKVGVDAVSVVVAAAAATDAC